MKTSKNDNQVMGILIIEDDLEMSSLLKDFLETEGFEAEAVNNSSDVFRILAQKTFDLIITDFRMPGLTGLDLIPGIKKISPQVAIIVITAFGSEKVHRRAIERGASGYLEKPISFNELRMLIREGKYSLNPSYILFGTQETIYCILCLHDNRDRQSPV